MNVVIVALSILTGAIVGGVFAYLGVPVPAPPTLAGVAGIVGIFLGYRIIDALDIGFDLLGALGIG